MTGLFNLGRVLAMPGALELLESYGKSPNEYLDRHASGDWGDLTQHDRHENELSLREGFRIFSAYTVSPLNTLWVITEADRASTTILLPVEY